MPHVNINISDNTGIEVTAQESVVFIPGGIDPAVAKDANNCIYISASQLSNIKSIFTAEKGVTKTAEAPIIGTVAMVEKCLEAGLDVIYCYVDKYAVDKLLPTSLDFLYDKDTYNVKFLTTGYLGGVRVTKGNAKATLSDGEGTDYTFDGAKYYSPLVKVAQKRTDCVVLAHAFYYDTASQANRNDTTKECLWTILDGVNSGDILNVQISKHLKTAFRR